MKDFIILFCLLSFIFCWVSYLYYMTQKQLNTARKDLETARTEQKNAEERRNSAMKELWGMRKNFINGNETLEWIKKHEKDGKICAYGIKTQIQSELDSQRIRHWIATGNESSRKKIQE